MSVTSARHQRLFVSVLIHAAAAASFIISSEVARDAGLLESSSHYAVKRSVIQRLHSPHSQHPLPSAPLSRDYGLQTETKREKPFVHDWSIFNHRSRPAPFAQGSFKPYDAKDNGQRGGRTPVVQTRVMKPASSIFTGLSMRGGQKVKRFEERGPKQPSRKPYSSSLVVKKTTLLNKTVGSPQTVKNKRNKEVEVHKNVQSEIKIKPTHADEPWSPPSFASRVHYKGNEATNEFPGEGPVTATPRVKTLVSNRLELSRNPDPERVTSSTQRFLTSHRPESSGLSLGHKRILLYPSKHSKGKDGGEGGWSSTGMLAQKPRPLGADERSSSTSNLQRNSGKDPWEDPKASSTKPESSTYPTADAAQAAAPSPSQSFTGQVMKSPSIDPGETRQNPIIKKLGPPADSGTTGLSRDHQPKWFRGFTNPLEQAVRESSGLIRKKSSQSLRLKAPPTPSFLVQKYRFGQDEVLADLPTEPVKMAGPLSSHDLLNSTNLLLEPQLKTVPVHFQYPRPYFSKSDNSVDGNQSEPKFQLLKFDLDWFGPRLLGGDKIHLQPLGTSAPVKAGQEESKRKSQQIWQPSRPTAIRRFNRTSIVPIERQNDVMSGDDFKPFPRTPAGKGVLRVVGSFRQGTKTVPLSNTTYQRLDLPFARVVSSARMGPKVPPTTSTGLPGKDEVVLKTPTSTTVRAKLVTPRNTSTKRNEGSSVSRNASIYRLPKDRGQVKALIYEDILGNASFSSIAGTEETNDTLFTNLTAELTGEWSSLSDERNESETVEAETLREVENVTGNHLDEGADEIKTSSLFSQSGGQAALNISNEISAVAENQVVRENLLELDYLRTSTGNVIFNSAEQLELSG